MYKYNFALGSSFKILRCRLVRSPLPAVRFLCAWAVLSAAGGFAPLSFPDWMRIELVSSTGETVSLSIIRDKKATVVLFLDLECPVSRKYGAVIRQLHRQSERDSLQVMAVYPATGITRAAVNGFAQLYRYPFVHLLDPQRKLVTALGARVTPQAFLIDNRGNVLYQGAIDNWFYALGRNRKVVTEHYLTDALAAFLAGKAIAVPEVPAVGCLINTGAAEHHPGRH